MASPSDKNMRNSLLVFFVLATASQSWCLARVQHQRLKKVLGWTDGHIVRSSFCWKLLCFTCHPGVVLRIISHTVEAGGLTQATPHQKHTVQAHVQLEPSITGCFLFSLYKYISDRRVDGIFSLFISHNTVFMKTFFFFTGSYNLKYNIQGFRRFHKKTYKRFADVTYSLETHSEKGD